VRSGAVQERVEARACHKYGFARAPTGSTLGPFFPGGGPPPWRKAMNRAAPACALLAATACGFASLAAIAGEPAVEPAAGPALRAVYDRTTTTVSRPRDSEPAATQVEPAALDVRLAPARLAVRTRTAAADIEYVYDFGALRVRMLDHGRHERVEFSLHAIPAFREIELENRGVMLKMLAALGQPADAATQESALALTFTPPAPLRLEERAPDGRRVYVLNGVETVAYEPDAAPLPPSLVPSLAHLLLYAAELHPRVREALLAEPRLPRRLEYTTVLGNERTTVVWELRERSTAAAGELQGAGAAYALRPVLPEGAAALAVRVPDAAAPPAPAAWLERIERLLAADHAFEAFLVATAAETAGVDVPDALFRRARDAGRRDARLQAVATALEREPRDPADALRRLAAVDARGLEGAEALDVLRASAELRRGRIDAAREALGAALALDPYLTGAWLDAGRTYFDAYRTPAAWACWDAARAVAPPGTSLLGELDRLEGGLRSRHPEYY
jgi:tetratricopeptide (TPR) repeat protein